MKLQIMSDLHNEFWKEIPAIETAPGVDCILFAGDVDNRPDELGKFMTSIPDIPKIMVAGNHEFYGGDINHRLGDIASKFTGDTPSTILLENSEAVLGDVVVLGTTLWTDLAKGTRARDVRRMMNDYECVTNGKRKLHTDATMALHKDALTFLEEALNHYHDKKIVILTHHAPSFLSNHSRYAGSEINSAFASNLEWLIEKYSPALWIHGHTHDSCDYVIGTTRVLCNPRGYPVFDYAGEGSYIKGTENKDFDPLLTVDL
jgi:predicted phosphodiesterase